MRVFLLIIALLALTACQTTVKDFGEVKEGMRKYDVLEIVGGPNSSTRWKGRDRWTYRFIDRDSEEVREVVFKEGRVIYAGEQVPPRVTAEDQDKINEESNRAAALRETELRQKLYKDWEEANQPKAEPLPTFRRVK